MNDERERPTTSKPIGGPEKKGGFPLLMVLLLFLAVLAVFALVTFLRYNT